MLPRPFGGQIGEADHSHAMEESPIDPSVDVLTHSDLSRCLRRLLVEADLEHGARKEFD